MKAVKPSYEHGMKITYDPGTKRVVLAFRGRITVLPDVYETEALGAAAAELYCRSHGWKPTEQGSTGAKRLNSLF